MTNKKKIELLKTIANFINYAIEHLENGTDPDYDIWSAFRILKLINRG